MSKVTSKLQVTIPKAIAEKYGIRPGDEIDWVPLDRDIRVRRGGARADPRDVKTRLEIFDASTARQLDRQGRVRLRGKAKSRGWTREELYERGGAD